MINFSFSVGMLACSHLAFCLSNFENNMLNTLLVLVDKTAHMEDADHVLVTYICLYM